MIDYTLTKDKDVYSITNNGTENIIYQLRKLSDCTHYLMIFDTIIEPGNKEIVSFTGDGEYQIILNPDTDNTILPIHHYLQLQTTIIEDVKDLICDCKECDCGDNCSESSSDSEICNILKIKTRIDTYKRLTNLEGVVFYDTIYNEMKCLINKSVYCGINDEILLGETDCNIKLTKQIIALDYLSMYFFEERKCCLSDDKTFVREKFKTEQIFCCVQSLGIDINKIENNLNEIDLMGIFTINNGAYVNQPASTVGNYTLDVANRADTTLTLGMFTTNTTPAYSDPEGDSVNAVRFDSLPADGVLQLNGVNVALNQVVLATDINAENLHYISPNQDALDTDIFNFSVRDSGSMQWSS